MLPLKKEETDNEPLVPLTIEQKRLLQIRRALRRRRMLERRRAALEGDSDDSVQDLSPGQLQLLAQKVVDLWRRELRIEDERFGRTNFR